MARTSRCSTKQTVSVWKVFAACVLLAGFIACALMLTGCGTTKGYVRVDGLAIEGDALARGTAVTIEGEQGDYYQVKLADGTSAWIEKRLVRADSEAAPAQTKGYATSGAQVFTTAYFTEAVATLAGNEEITVLDAFGDVAYVQTAAGVNGYMSASNVMSSPATARQNSDSSKSSSNSGSSSASPAPSSGDTGGNTSSSDSSSGSVDGEEISLTSAATGIDAVGAVLTELNPFRVDVAYAAETQTTPAKVLADGTKTIVAFLNRGDEVAIVKTENGVTTLKINGKEYTVSAELVRGEKEAAPESKTMYAVQGAVVSPVYPLGAEQIELAPNTVVTVVDTIGDVLVVQVDGATYYTTAVTLSDTQVEVVVVTTNTQRSSGGSSNQSAQTQSNDSGQSADAGSGSSGGSSSQDSAEQQWTRPTK